MAVAISYSRWSTEAQTAGDSHRRQITAAQDYAQSRGLRLIQSFKDSAISAYRGKNAIDGALADLIAAANDGHVSPGTVLIIESLDRISRQSVDKSVMLLLQILNMGIEVVTLFDKMVYKTGDRDLAMRLMAAIMVFGRANDESDTKSLRGKAAWIAKHQAAASGKIITKSIPSWLNIVDGKMVINEHGNNIRKIIDMALNDNVGCHTIANRLNASNIPCGAKAKLWTAPNVRRYLTSPQLSGRLVSTHNGREVEDYYPPLISKEDHAKLLGILSSRKTQIVSGNTNNNWLSGLLHCSCGSTMFKVRTNYYVCKARYQEGVKACPSLQIPIHETSYAIAYMLGSWMPNDINTPKIAPDVSLLIKEKEALEDALPAIKDKTRLIIKINALDAQIKQLIQSSDDRLVPMSYSVEMMVDLCAKIWTSKRHQITTQMYMAIRPHLLRVVNKIVIDRITHIKSIDKSAYRTAVVHAYDGAQMEITINLPIQGDNNNVRWAQALAGSNIFKIV